MYIVKVKKVMVSRKVHCKIQWCQWKSFNRLLQTLLQNDTLLMLGDDNYDKFTQN